MPICPSLLTLPNHAPRDIYSRKYKLLDQILTQGSDIYLFPFEALYNQSIFKEINENHRFFRADAVHLDIQVSGPISVYGFAAVSWYPLMEDLPDVYGTYTDIRTWRDFVPLDFATLALGDSESIEMMIKWQAPYHVAARELSDPAIPENTQWTIERKLRGIGRLNINVPALAQIDNASPSVSIRVFASFVNPHISGPIVPGGPSLPELQPGQLYTPQVTLQSGVLTNRYGQNYSWDNVATIGTLATAASGAIYQNGLTAANYVNTFQKSMTTVGTAFKNIRSYTSSMFEESEPTQKPLVTRDNMLDNANHVSVRQNVWGDTASLSVNDAVLRISEIPTGSVVPSDITGCADEIDIYALMQRWNYQNLLFIKTGQNASVESNYIKVHPAASKYGYVRFMTNFFRLYRGSLEYRFKFFGSALATYQVAININFDVNGAGDSITSVSGVGNTTTKLITVRGTTTASISVPFMRESLWARCDDLDVPTITITAFQIGSTMGATADPLILPTLVLQRVGQDFRFRSLVSGVKTPYTPAAGTGTPIGLPQPPVELQGLLDHDPAPETMIGAINTQVEQMCFHGNIKDIMTRDSLRKPDAFYGIGFIPGQSVADKQPADVKANIYNDGFDNFDLMATMFAGFSGSMVVKAAFKVPGNEKEIYAYLEDIGGRPEFSVPPNFQAVGGNGLYRTEEDVWRFIEVEVPFISPWAFLPIHFGIGRLAFTPPVVFSNYFSADYASLYVTDGESTLTPDTPYFVSAGRDFALHVLWPPLNEDVFPSRAGFNRIAGVETRQTKKVKSLYDVKPPN